MKAIIYTHYGSPDVLQFKEVEKPAPKDDEVVIHVAAGIVNVGMERNTVLEEPYENKHDCSQ